MALSIGLLAAALVASVLGTPSVDIAYCASANTATGSSNTSIYQSDGLCYDLCYDDYAYALVSGNECWCSDYTPSESVQVDTSECDEACDGYPSDWCGGDGLYAYMALSKSPSGTAGVASSSSAAATTTSSSSFTTTAKTTTSSTSTTSTTSATSATSTTPTTTSTPTTSSTFSTSTVSTSISKTTSTSTPATVQTVTAAGGIVQTVTVTPTSSTATAAASGSSHKSVSTGAAVGIAVGVVGAAALGGIGAFMLWRRKRRQRDAIYAEHNSKATSPRGTTPNASTPKVSEVSTGGPFADQSGRRRSALMPIDPRIDPAFSGIYARAGENKSRDSVNSLRDDHDYSRRVHQPNRVLRATNPDPENE